MLRSQINIKNDCDEEEKSEDKNEFDAFLQKKLLEQRVIVISTDINAKVAEQVIKTTLLLDFIDNTKPITYIINSPGGEVYSGFAIYDIMKAVKSPVRTLVTGFAASMGSIIMLGAPKGSRFMTRNSKVMIHQPLISGYYQAKATDIEIQANEIQQTKDKIIDLYVAETGKSRDEVAKDIETDHWLTAEQTVEYGLMDKIINSLSEIPLS